MRNLYPLKFEPIYKEKIWGGNRIKTFLKKDVGEIKNCGESWELSGLNGNLSIVKNGFLAGNNIAELSEIYMGDLVGEKVFEQYGIELPLLFKYIDSNEYLSIQVHPDDNIAKKKHNSYGKTEMWYVVHAEPDSEIIVGLKRNITKKEFVEHLENKTLKKILNIEKVKKGDVLYIPAGRIHSIGSGILLAEIQQSSDITYRIYDWDRKDDDGKSRELHTDLALDAIDLKAHPNYKTEYSESLNQSVELVKSSHFNTNLVCFDKKIETDYGFLDSFIVFMCIEGEFSIEYENGHEPIKQGETVLIPSALKTLKMHPLKPSKFLETYIT